MAVIGIRLPSLNGRFRSLALVVLACLLSAIAGVVAPEAGAQAEPGACRPENIAGAGFSDLAGLSAESRAAIDCVSHFGITRGVTATTFGPNRAVTRVQMARFLVRTATVLELEALAGDSAQFEDMGSVSAEARADVARLVAMGVARGTSESTFAPQQTVARAHMALFLHRLLTLAEISLPGAEGSALGDLGGESAEARAAIATLVAAGVMDPRTPEAFAPREPVVRHEMALMLARVLDLAGADPNNVPAELLAPVATVGDGPESARLTVTVESDSMLLGESTEATIVAVRANGEPYEGLLVDVFVAPAVGAGGVCNLDDGAHVNGAGAGTSSPCRIDLGDPRTDAQGLLTVGLAHNASQATGWVHVWAGKLGDRYHPDVDAQAQVRIGWRDPPTEMALEDPFQTVLGQSTAVRAHLSGPNAAGLRVVLLASSADGTTRTTLSGTTGGSGRVTFTLSAPGNPFRERRGLSVTETVIVFWDRNANGRHDGPSELSAGTTITWR